jgi:conjugal transfer pilus assembly protein TraK
VSSIAFEVVAEEKTVEIPLIPISAMTASVPVKPQNNVPLEMKPVTINMRPGINEIVAIAKGHLNRIVTPFETPKVATISNAQITTSENVIYVSSDDNAPVTIFITQSDTEQSSLSLTLVPKKIPPQEVFLNAGPAGLPLSGSGAGTASAFGIMSGIVNKPAKRWETKTKYIETIKNVMTGLAHGELPDGYQMTPLSRVANVLSQPYCDQRGVSFDFSNAQAMFGHYLNVTVAIAENTSDKPIELLPNPCLHIAAFASWPEVLLNPGEKTEVYIVRKQNETRQVKTKRPSLLNL